MEQTTFKQALAYETVIQLVLFPGFPTENSEEISASIREEILVEVSEGIPAVVTGIQRAIHSEILEKKL